MPGPALCARNRGWRSSSRACTTTGSNRGPSGRSTDTPPVPARARSRRDRTAGARSTPSGRARGTGRSGRSLRIRTRSGRPGAPAAVGAEDVADRLLAALRARAGAAGAACAGDARARRPSPACARGCGAVAASRCTASFSKRGSERSQWWFSKNRITELVLLHRVSTCWASCGTEVGLGAGVRSDRRRTENEGAQAHD